jgi:type I restriction enzyme R subunit
MPYNEEDTKLHLITPALARAGWTGLRITMEYPITAGQIVLQGDDHKQLPPKKADYLLRYAESLPIAVLEAKDEEHTPGAGLQRAQAYAEMLELEFAYSSNGHGIEEWDFTTNTQRSLGMDEMPTPEALWQRLCDYRALQVQRAANPLLHPYWHDPAGQKRIRYYQEVAVNRVLEGILKGQRRILINLATGTGKTFIAFQLVWRLIKSGHFATQRVLFLADRLVLRSQAYNTFEPFKEGAGDPREEIVEGEIKRGRQIYFGIYQTLYAPGPDGLRAFEQFPPDYFDLIIIDECHRSGFGTWNEILQHFPNAIQLGMTATPKRTDNIDTYAYFGEPVFSYSLGQGIDDGFLANYKVYTVTTNFDAEGLDLPQAREAGATVYIPEGIEPRQHYGTPDFERQVAMPDRVERHCQHLANLLQICGRMEKTIIFCVSQEHAEQVRDILNRLNAGLNIPHYAVRIVSEEADAQAWLERFQAVEKPTPVVACTVDLLTTGVDAPSVRNIVFFRTITSPHVFKQMVGRGTRLCEDTDKYWFRVIDYTGAARFFDEWDKPSPPPAGGAQTAGPRVCWLAGKVTSAKTGSPLVDAVVTVQIGPNEIVQQRTGSDGQFFFPDLPAGTVLVTVTAYGYARAQTTMDLAPEQPALRSFTLEERQPPKERMILVTGLQVHIVEERYEERDARGNLVSPQDYLQKVRAEIQEVCASLLELRAQWSDPARRQELLASLEQRQVALDVLTEILQRPDVDCYDLLAHIAFDEGLYSREERAVALFNVHQDFFATYDEPARQVLRVLVEKYVLGGVDEVLDPQVFTLPPIQKEVGQVAQLFGGMPQLRQARDEMIRRLYQ